MSVLSVLVSCLLIVSYLLFARAWIQYQSEQALYCLAENQPAYACRHQLEKALRRCLPYGELRDLTVFTTNARWNVNLQWRTGWDWPHYVMKVQKQLSAKKINGNNKDLRS